MQKIKYIINKLSTSPFKNLREPRKVVYMRGFSLIELLVSISIFTFVALVAIASLVSTMQLNARLKATRALYDNMYFTMDEITRELRQGSNFQNEVAGAYTTIVFTQYQPGTASRYKYKYVLNNNNAIEKFEIDTKDTLSIADDTSTSLGLMTNSNIKITGLKFEIIGSGKYIDGDRQQPSIKMIVRGETKEKPFANFQLENYVTQRGAGE